MVDLSVIPGRPTFFARFRRSVIDLCSPEQKAALVTSMAERCIAGEFNGSSFLAAQDPDCVRLGINESSIRRRIVACNPAAAATRAAERARVATETAAAEVARVPVKFIFVERAGSAPATAAVEAAMGLIESQMGGSCREGR